MKGILLLLSGLCFIVQLNAQEKKAQPVRTPLITDLTDLNTSIRMVQGDLSLYVKNVVNPHSQEHDVNSIILDIEKYIDSMPRSRGAADQYLVKLFNPMRHFFLTTTNKTTVATSFLYSGTPYRFCNYNDTAVALHFYAIKDGTTYNLGKMTEKKVVKTSFENCLMPALRAFDEFKEGAVKYIALSIYFGCKDNREGAPTGQITPYCLTLVTSIANLQPYAAGLITTKGLIANAEIFLSSEEDANELTRIHLNLD